MVQRWGLANQLKTHLFLELRHEVVRQLLRQRADHTEKHGRTVSTVPKQIRKPMLVGSLR